MAVSLKWKGDELFLGKTKMGLVMMKPSVNGWVYVLGPEDSVSDPYQRKDDARQDCETVVRDMLSRAGA